MIISGEKRSRLLSYSMRTLMRIRQPARSRPLFKNKTGVKTLNKILENMMLKKRLVLHLPGMCLADLTGLLQFCFYDAVTTTA